MNWYTRKGSQSFNAQVDTLLTQMSDEVASAVGDGFVALILGGGYGREEGACVLRLEKESLYNDLDLFLITSSPYRLSDEVGAVQKKYEHLLGIDVDIGAPLTIQDIEQLPTQLMWHDLLNGHLVLKGPKDSITAHRPAPMNDRCPQVESIRLSLNRGSGLLQAIIASESENPLSDPDFIRRNYFKTALAFGDCLCITHKVYTVNLPERLNRLNSLKDILPEQFKQTVPGLYADAIDFKQSPDTFDRNQTDNKVLKAAARLWCDLFLYGEEIRTERTFADTAAYQKADFIREPEQHRGKNLIRNIVKNLQIKRVSFRYPRERLYGELLDLLNAPNPKDTQWLRRSNEFLNLWNTYN